MIPRKVDRIATWVLLDLIISTEDNPDFAFFHQEYDRVAPKLYVVDQRRGSAYEEGSVITIPLWALKRGSDYTLYYVAHELTHLAAEAWNHGPKFMAALKRICPAHIIHYELDYQPKNALAAGILAEDF